MLVVAADDTVAPSTDDTRAAHARNKPVVNARKARCRSFLSRCIGLMERTAGGYKKGPERPGLGGETIEEERR
jgi:hypothetical protein